MVKNYQLRKETSSQLPTKTALVEEEQLGEFYQVLRIRKKERYINYIKFRLNHNQLHKEILFWLETTKRRLKRNLIHIAMTSSIWLIVIWLKQPLHQKLKSSSIKWREIIIDTFQNTQQETNTRKPLMVLLLLIKLLPKSPTQN